VALEVVFLRPAENRLTELGLYIAGEAGVRIANDYLDRIHAACMALADFPNEDGTATTFCPGFAQSPWSAE
jgi:plasmid stabilization system protein ParE